MAYAVKLDQKCSEEGCESRATHEVRNRYNEAMRRCCERHAKEWVALISEKESGAAGRGDVWKARRL